MWTSPASKLILAHRVLPKLQISLTSAISCFQGLLQLDQVHSDNFPILRPTVPYNITELGKWHPFISTGSWDYDWTSLGGHFRNCAYRISLQGISDTQQHLPYSIVLFSPNSPGPETLHQLTYPLLPGSHFSSLLVKVVTMASLWRASSLSSVCLTSVMESSLLVG